MPVTPNCPRCEGTTFYGWNYAIASAGQVVLVHCSSCGCVVGAVPQER